MIDVAEVARRCLDAVVAVHDEEGWPLPERRYVAGGVAGEVAADDEHLLVALVGLFPGPTEASSRAGAIQGRGLQAKAVPYATLAVRLMRCVPTQSDWGPPTAEQLHASGMELLTDPGRLYTALVRWRSREPGPGQGLVTVGQVEPIDSGDLAGHLAYITVSPVQ